MIGGIASTTSASNTFLRPIPRNAEPIASTTRLGSARHTFPRLMATNEPRCRCPSQTPTGTAITSEIAIASTVTLSVPSA